MTYTNHQVVPNCTPKKAKCKGVAISFTTSTGCTVSIMKIYVSIFNLQPVFGNIQPV